MLKRIGYLLIWLFIAFLVMLSTVGVSVSVITERYNTQLDEQQEGFDSQLSNRQEQFDLAYNNQRDEFDDQLVRQKKHFNEVIAEERTKGYYRAYYETCYFLLMQAGYLSAYAKQFCLENTASAFRNKAHLSEPLPGWDWLTIQQLAKPEAAY